MIRTLIVDDQNIIRKGIKVLLEDSDEIELVGFAVDGETALENIKAAEPDVVLLDINLPGIDGLTVAEQINTNFPQIKVIMLSSHEEEEYVRKAMASSAKGYLLKNVSAEELEWSIKLVHQGYSAFKSELLKSLQKSEPAVKIRPKLPEDIQVVSVPRQDNLILTSPTQEKNSEELELILARNQVRQKYQDFKHQRRSFAFHDVSVSRAKKTMMSFEFKLLVFIILFSLGFLAFVALS
ncbi:MAG: response regulator transcription factor [Cyanobacteria bacterium J06623_7]